jgi:hypothetical protein
METTQVAPERAFPEKVAERMENRFVFPEAAEGVQQNPLL